MCSHDVLPEAQEGLANLLADMAETLAPGHGSEVRIGPVDFGPEKISDGWEPPCPADHPSECPRYRCQRTGRCRLAEMASGTDHSAPLPTDPHHSQPSVSEPPTLLGARKGRTMSWEAIKKRLAAATPGPWDWTGGMMAEGSERTYAGYPQTIHGQHEGHPVLIAQTFDGHEDEAPPHADFIAHSPTDIAALLAVAEAAATFSWYCTHEGEKGQGTCLCSSCRMRAALDALEALP